MHRILALTVAAAFGLAACAHTSPHTPHWSYAGDAGPDRWASLDAGYATCGAGKHQSPVDLDAARPGPMTALDFQYRPTKAVVKNNGHAIQVDLAEGGTITLGERAYRLKQFHFHLPAEHAIGGERPPAELHLVHADSTGALAVVGVFLRAGADSAALAPVLADLPRAEGDSRALTATFDPSTLLPADHQQFRYDGSLTTPPCAEGVTWTVMKTPMELSESQLGALRARYDGNSRPLQPLGDRTIATDAAN